MYIVEFQALGDIVVRGRFEVKLSKHDVSLILNNNIGCYRVAIVIPGAERFYSLRAVGNHQNPDTFPSAIIRRMT